MNTQNGKRWNGNKIVQTSAQMWKTAHTACSDSQFVINRTGKLVSSPGFTLLELLVVLCMIWILAGLMLPAQMKTRPGTQVLRCLNNHRQMVNAWSMYAEDFSQVLVATAHLTASTRPAWMTGALDYNGSNQSNWNTNLDIAGSPLWPYMGKSASLIKCPGDKSTVVVSGKSLPRVRSLSMSQVFGMGEWLDKTYNIAQTVWRLYSAKSSVVFPAKTYVFVDEHPDSINDAGFANACTGAQPGDPPSSAQIIDFPANYHDGGASISFSDGHCDLHKWIGSKLRMFPITYSGALTINVSAGDSWIDVQWLAQNTTVRQ